MRTKNNDRRAVAAWLYLCAVTVFAILVIGGITRLTRSGLSIVEWKPVSGTLPPLTEQEWLVEFDKYQKTPEYREVNRGMSLQEFKGIFWWEYLHRLMGRFVGLLFLLPFLYFLIRKKIPAGLAPRLVLVFILGGLQGALGWYMVKSGLVKDPRVSHLRLMSHLLLAVTLYALLLWSAWRVTPAAAPRLRNFSWLNLGLTFILLASGALVAGLKAGKMYNTFPLMNGSYFPPGIAWLEPFSANFTDNPAIVQFIHRNLAYALGLALALQIWFRRHRPDPGLILLACVYALQVILGVLTLLHAVPVFLGSLHQANALLLFTIALYLAKVSARSNPGVR